MSLLTKLRELLGIGRKKPGRVLRKPQPPDDAQGSAGVPAKIPPRVPTLSGANALPFPPE
ncbi:MAG TPA: hypothetical protein VFO29_02915 [Candidatus Rubrimentiphilum sp.]|nr:hypothetical protein [Candidatus Rubrimentiphilum sp.]